MAADNRLGNASTPQSSGLLSSFRGGNWFTRRGQASGSASGIGSPSQPDSSPPKSMASSAPGAAHRRLAELTRRLASAHQADPAAAADALNQALAKLNLSIASVRNFTQEVDAQLRASSVGGQSNPIVVSDDEDGTDFEVVAFLPAPRKFFEDLTSKQSSRVESVPSTPLSLSTSTPLSLSRASRKAIEPPREPTPLQEIDEESDDDVPDLPPAGGPRITKLSEAIGVRQPKKHSTKRVKTTPVGSTSAQKTSASGRSAGSEHAQVSAEEREFILEVGYLAPSLAKIFDTKGYPEVSSIHDKYLRQTGNKRLANLAVDLVMSYYKRYRAEEAKALKEGREKLLTPHLPPKYEHLMPPRVETKGTKTASGTRSSATTKKPSSIKASTSIKKPTGIKASAGTKASTSTKKPISTKTTSASNTASASTKTSSGRKSSSGSKPSAGDKTSDDSAGTETPVVVGGTQKRPRSPNFAIVIESGRNPIKRLRTVRADADQDDASDTSMESVFTSPKRTQPLSNNSVAASQSSDPTALHAAIPERTSPDPALAQAQAETDANTGSSERTSPDPPLALAQADADASTDSSATRTANPGHTSANAAQAQAEAGANTDSSERTSPDPPQAQAETDASTGSSERTSPDPPLAQARADADASTDSSATQTATPGHTSANAAQAQAEADANTDSRLSDADGSRRAEPCAVLVTNSAHSDGQNVARSPATAAQCLLQAEHRPEIQAGHRPETRPGKGQSRGPLRKKAPRSKSLKDRLSEGNIAAAWHPALILIHDILSCGPVDPQAIVDEALTLLRPLQSDHSAHLASRFNTSADIAATMGRLEQGASKINTIHAAAMIDLLHLFAMDRQARVQDHVSGTTAATERLDNAKLAVRLRAGGLSATIGSTSGSSGHPHLVADLDGSQNAGAVSSPTKRTAAERSHIKAVTNFIKAPLRVGRLWHELGSALGSVVFLPLLMVSKVLATAHRPKKLSAAEWSALIQVLRGARPEPAPDKPFTDADTQIVDAITFGVRAVLPRVLFQALGVADALAESAQRYADVLIVRDALDEPVIGNEEPSAIQGLTRGNLSDAGPLRRVYGLELPGSKGTVELITKRPAFFSENWSTLISPGQNGEDVPFDQVTSSTSIRGATPRISGVNFADRRTFHLVNCDPEDVLCYGPSY
ncbi:hypothetical protein OC844_005794 [Tilletia horrida]|nr:hypothetical protein OC844_005794 [Tilletia horrida]